MVPGLIRIGISFFLFTSTALANPVCGRVPTLPIRDPRLPTLVQNRLDSAYQWIDCIERTQPFITQTLAECKNSSMTTCLFDKIQNYSKNTAWPAISKLLVQFDQNQQSRLLEQCGVISTSDLTPNRIQNLTQCLTSQTNQIPKPDIKILNDINQKFTLLFWLCNTSRFRTLPSDSPPAFTSGPGDRNFEEAVTRWIDNYLAQWTSHKSSNDENGDEKQLKSDQMSTQCGIASPLEIEPQSELFQQAHQSSMSAKFK